MIFQKTYQWGRVYRNGELVCARARVTIGEQQRSVGLTQRERCFVTVAFRENTVSHLRDDLAKLRKRRGRAAELVADRLAPITVVVRDDHKGKIEVEGYVQPPKTRAVGDFSEVDFPVREKDGGLPPAVIVPAVAPMPRPVPEQRSFGRVW